MTFSISASGTKQQAIDSLSKHVHHDELGAAITQVLVDAITAGPDEVLDGKQPIYSVSGSGHHATPSSPTPSLSISLYCSYQPVPIVPGENGVPGGF